HISLSSVLRALHSFPTRRSSDLGVVIPRDEDDLRALVRYAAEYTIPLIARGAGTGLAGESLGPGLVVDMSRHFRFILAIDATSVDRKSTRLNSSHVSISYAVFCL